jgi:hypothetical protein
LRVLLPKRRRIWHRASDAVGENQRADDGDCDHAEEESNRPPTVGVWAMRTVFFVWGHRANLLFGPRHLANVVVNE